jgi:hypothetical protein
MSGPRPTLTLYALDRPALKTLAAELKTLLLADDRVGLAKTLELGPSIAERLATGARAVDWLLRPETDPEANPIFASLRRVTKKRALTLAWKSEEPSLEGRLRNFDVLREDRKVAALIDKLLDAERLPWFMVRPGATCGWLDADPRDQLASELRALRPALPKELAEFVSAIDAIEGAVVAHDAL